MPAPPPVTALDDERLRSFYDPGALSRGEAYADEGRIELLGSGAGSIKAVCRGSGRATYVVSVHWFGAGGALSLDDSCSCPLGEACKHCVAAILTARERATSKARIADAAHLLEKGLGASSTSSTSASDWRRRLAALDADLDADHGPRWGLALQIVVDRPGRALRSGRARADVRLHAQPLRRGTSGRWIKSGATWRDLTAEYSAPRAELDRGQVSALRALASTATGSYQLASIPWWPLDRFGGELWYGLDRAVEAGVALIGEHEGDEVVLSSGEATVALDLTTGSHGTVTMTAGFTVDDEPIEVDGVRAGVIGAPGLGLWIAEGRRVRLVRFRAPLHRVVDELVGAGPLTVPGADVDELLDVYQPALARHASVGSSDGSVVITESRLDAVVLVVDRTALTEAALRWEVRYRRGDREVRHRVAAPGGRGRDRASEAELLAAVRLPTHLLPTIADAHGRPRDLTVSGVDALVLLRDVVPWLEATGDVDVEISGDQPDLREATDAPRISLTVADDPKRSRREGTDWFELEVEVSVDGEVVEFVPLFTALAQGDDTLVLPSGTWLRLDRPELVELRTLIEEARGLAEPTAAGTVPISRFQTSWWDDLMALGVVTEQSARWAESVAQMSTLAAPEPIGCPAGLHAELRPYQQEGLDWLAFLHGNGLGGILADDMGLGKTVQALGLLVHVLESRPDARFLVVAPTSVVENWSREAARFAPDLAVTAIRETAARRGMPLGEAINGASLVITSYALFRLEADAYGEHDWEVLLLDEAQFVKNHTGKTYRCVRALPAATKIAMTGTPLENTLMDLWSLLSITAPGLYPDPKRFATTFRKPIESGDAPELLATLRRRIAPLMRRRTKDAVLTELPPKIEQTVEVQLSSRHERIYQTQLQRQRQKVLGLVGDLQAHRFEILRSLTILRQLALDPGLVDEAHADVGSAKLDRLVDDLTQVIAEGHRALVFSQFTRYLAKVRQRLDAAGIDHAYLDGSTRDRPAEISRFKDGDLPVFVISLKAGGFGLNLTEADYCFVLDPWWNPASENQAIDRVHRIGQEHPVVAYRYVSAGTIEEKVMELKARKADLFDRVLDGEGALAGALTEDDIRGLLDLA